MVTVHVENRGDFRFDSETCFWHGIPLNVFKEMIGANCSDEIIVVRTREHPIPSGHRVYPMNGDRIKIKENGNG